MIIWVVVAVAGLIGAALLWAGLRGRRIDDHPVCRRCRFDLHGLATRADARACPECGHDLRSPRGTRIGNRKPRAAAIAMSVLLLAATVALAGAYTGMLRGGISWTRYAPTATLVWLAESSGPGLQVEALTELQARVGTDRIDAAQRDAVTRRALALQKDRSVPWEPAWGGWVEKLYASGVLSDTDWREYAENSYEILVHTRPIIRPGDNLPIVVHAMIRAAERSSLRHDFLANGATVNGRAIRLNFRREKYKGNGQVSRMDWLGVCDSNLVPWSTPFEPHDPTFPPPGVHEVKFKVGVWVDAETDATGMVKKYTPGDRVEYLVEKTVEHSAVLRVTKPNEADVELLPRNDHRGDIEAFLRSVEYVVEVESDYDHPRLVHTSHSAGLPIPISLSMSLQIDDEEYPIGVLATSSLEKRIAIRDKQILHAWGVVGSVQSSVLEGKTHASIVFRPCIEAARDTVHLTEIWDGDDIVIENVPIEHRAATPPLTPAPVSGGE